MRRQFRVRRGCYRRLGRHLDFLNDVAVPVLEKLRRFFSAADMPPAAGEKRSRDEDLHVLVAFSEAFGL